MNNDIIVSVWTIVYNHEKYIAQAIESVLSQKCNFKIEMIIGEDCSTDNSREIIRQYHEKYPDIIRPIYNTLNVGAQANAINCINAAKGKYLAILEGDDYWIDDDKLQKQVDFMEQNPDFSACFTKAAVLNELGTENRAVYNAVDKDVFTFDDFVVPYFYFIPSPTLLYRSDLHLPGFFAHSITGDIALHLLLAGKGSIKLLPETTAVYRVHSGGLSKSAAFNERLEDAIYALYANIDKYFNYKYHQSLKNSLLPRLKTKLIYGSKELKGMKKLRHVIKIGKHYFFYSDKINLKEVMYYAAILFFPAVLKIKQAAK
jgi:glycosyltransferase involved in cell wall biosynthesis